ncbi:MAG: ABC transporter ATP-binding protein [Xanthobacteraceae bacterium]
MNSPGDNAADPYSARILIKRLLTEYATQHIRLYVLAGVMMMVGAACMAASAYLIGDMINQAYVNRNFPAILALSIATTILYTVRGAATYGQAVLMSRIGTRIVADNQRRVFEKLLNEGLGYFADRHSSEFIARLTTGANSAAGVINLLITAVGRDLASLIGLVAVMVVQNPALSLVSFVILPPALLVLRKLIRRLRTVARTQFDYATRTMETVQETVQGMPTVKAFTLEGVMRERLDKTISVVEREAFKLARVSNRASPLMETLGGIVLSIAMIYCGYLVVVDGQTPGQFFSFLAAFLLAYEPAKRLARLNLDLHTNLVGVRVLFEILDSPATEPIEDGKPPLRVTEARVEFADVRFNYRTGEPVLRGMSFTADPAKLTALVGPSGGGKSTVLNLILRFYEVERGAITIDGQNITDHSRQSLRHHLAYVGQHVYLFRGSIRDNIVLGKPEASEAEIVAAAKAAHAHDFIMSFPNGYDTPVGEHGMQLSGGQRQRVAIARALIRNAPLILLDEATAALDPESELHVQQALAELCAGRTTIAIAHRLATVMHADRILFIESGAVVECGRHDELLRKGGRYASFCRLQFKQQELPIAAASVG